MESTTAIRFVFDSSNERTRIRYVVMHGQLFNTNVNYLKGAGLWQKLMKARTI